MTVLQCSAHERLVKFGTSPRAGEADCN